MTTLTLGTSVVQWGREHGTEARWSTALDNYEPSPRSWASGILYHAVDHQDRAVIIIDGVGGLRDAHRSTYLIDNGRTVRPMYVAGYKTDGDWLLLHDFPTNYDQDGSRLTRPDGREVNFDSWQIGPRRAYHIKVALVV